MSLLAEGSKQLSGSCSRRWLCLQRAGDCQGAQGHQGRVTTGHGGGWSWDLSGARCHREGSACSTGARSGPAASSCCAVRSRAGRPLHPTSVKESLISQSTSLTLILYPLQRRSPVALTEVSSPQIERCCG